MQFDGTRDLFVIYYRKYKNKYRINLYKRSYNASLWMYRGDSNADTIQRSLKSRNKVQAVPSHGFLRPPNQQKPSSTKLIIKFSCRLYGAAKAVMSIQDAHGFIKLYCKFCTGDFRNRISSIALRTLISHHANIMGGFD